MSASVPGGPGISLVMPMAGRGSRFAREGVTVPKPLVEIDGMPFLWWAAESVRRAIPVAEMAFVVLAEHVDSHRIDRRIAEFYPEAKVAVVSSGLGGAAATAAVGVAALSGSAPVAVNDCDHAFACRGMAGAVARFWAGDEAALLCFRSASPAYSYVRLDAGGSVAGTVEKVVASCFAIAGCYLFASPSAFSSSFEGYSADCPYPETYVSGLYNRIIGKGGRVGLVEADRHVAFGTPDEFARASAAGVASILGWS